MNMKMINGLAAVGLAVDHEAGAPFAAVKAFGEFLCPEKQAAKKSRIRGVQIHYAPDMLFGDHQEVNRRLGVHIVEGQEFLVFKNLVGRNLPFYNFTENAVAHVSIIP
jgi:hypothetical protein